MKGSSLPPQRANLDKQMTSIEISELWQKLKAANMSYKLTSTLLPVSIIRKNKSQDVTDFQMSIVPDKHQGMTEEVCGC